MNCEQKLECIKECNCSKEDLKRVLKLLFNKNFIEDICFDKFGFIGDKFMIGSFLEFGDIETLGGKDNITKIDATFSALLDETNFIEIKGNTNLVYPNNQELTNVKNPIQMSIYNLCAVIFKVKNSFDYEKFEKILNTIDEKIYGCHEILIENPYSLDAGYISLSAGYLYVQDAKIIGKIGNALILKNSQVDVLYLIDEECIEFKA